MWFRSSYIYTDKIKSTIDDVCWLQILESHSNLPKISNWEDKQIKTLKITQKSFSPQNGTFQCKRYPQKFYLTTPLYSLSMFSTNPISNRVMFYQFQVQNILKTHVGHCAVDNAHCSINNSFNRRSLEPCGSYCCS